MTKTERIEYLLQCAQEDASLTTDPELLQYYEGQALAYQMALTILKQDD